MMGYADIYFQRILMIFFTPSAQLIIASCHVPNDEGNTIFDRVRKFLKQADVSPENQYSVNRAFKLVKIPQTREVD